MSTRASTPRTLTGGRLLAGLAAGLLALGGCAGGGGNEAAKPAAQILTDAQTAAKNAASVHVVGDLNRAGGTGKLDLVATRNGDGHEEIVAAGRTIDIVKVGPTVYVQGLPGTGPGYQQLPAGDPRAAAFASRVDKNALFDQLVRPRDPATIIGTAPVGGQQAVQLKPQAGPGVLDVSADASHPYPLRLASSAQSTITFTDWDKPVTITAPRPGGN